MLARTQAFLEAQLLAIPPDFADLLAQMRMAATEINGNLDKTKHAMDLLDALRLALLYYLPPIYILTMGRSKKEGSSVDL
jgi:hypothetical protein